MSIINPKYFNFIDSVDYKNKSFSHKVADSLFSFTRIAVGGRKIVGCIATDKTRNVAIRVLSGIIAFTIGAPLTLVAIAIKLYHSKTQKTAYKGALINPEKAAHFPHSVFRIESQGDWFKYLAPTAMRKMSDYLWGNEVTGELLCTPPTIWKS